jgi:hypothetical protein
MRQSLRLLPCGSFLCGLGAQGARAAPLVRSQPSEPFCASRPVFGEGGRRF